MVKVVIEKIPFESQALECLWDKEKRSVRWGEKEYPTLAALLKACNGLQQQGLALAKVANYFFQGMSFVVIEDPQRFCRDYEERVLWEKAHPEQAPWAQLCEFGDFDLSAMALPKIEGDMLTFYAFHRQSAVPYIVQCPYPSLLQEDPVYHYLLLPRKAQEGSLENVVI